MITDLHEQDEMAMMVGDSIIYVGDIVCSQLLIQAQIINNFKYFVPPTPMSRIINSSISCPQRPCPNDEFKYPAPMPQFENKL